MHLRVPGIKNRLETVGENTAREQSGERESAINAAYCFSPAGHTHAGCAIVIMDYCTGQAISHCVYVMRRVHRCVFSICVAQKFNAQDKQLAWTSRECRRVAESMEIKPIPMVATAVAARLSCSNVNCNALCSRRRHRLCCLLLLCALLLLLPQLL